MIGAAGNVRRLRALPRAPRPAASRRARRSRAAYRRTPDSLGLRIAGFFPSGARCGRHEAVSGLTPLQVLLHIMRIYFQAEDWDKAAENAARAAPFMHAKLIATQVTMRRPDEMSDDELLSSIAIAESHGTDEAVRGDVPGGADETRH
jgi:hypothetical protein